MNLLLILLQILLLVRHSMEFQTNSSTPDTHNYSPGFLLNPIVHFMSGVAGKMFNFVQTFWGGLANLTHIETMTVSPVKLRPVLSAQKERAQKIISKSVPGGQIIYSSQSVGAGASATFNEAPRTGKTSKQNKEAKRVAKLIKTEGPLKVNEDAISEEVSWFHHPSE